MSGAEANLFADTVNGFVERVKKIGPLGKAEGIHPETLQARLAEVTKLVPYIKRVNQEKLATRLHDPSEYDRLFTQNDVEKMFREIVSYYIDPTKCQACMICARRCPEEAISGGKNQIHVVDQEKCIKCETCFIVCPTRFNAVMKISGAPVPPPLPADQRAIVTRVKEKQPALN
jgi:Fe-S-cluster-containing hydrogenase component 2